MIVITRESCAAGATKRWKDQYGPERNNGRWYVAFDKRDRSAVYERLLALGPAPKPDEVDAVVGNSSWTDTPRCSECDSTDNAPRVRVGEEPDYESNTAWLCLSCAENAVAMLRSATGND